MGDEGKTDMEAGARDLGRVDGHSDNPVNVSASTLAHIPSAYISAAERDVYGHVERRFKERHKFKINSIVWPMELARNGVRMQTSIKNL